MISNSGATGRLAARQRAITLIELCVVLAVLAFAIALASISAQAVRASSKQSVCMSRLGQVIEAGIIYASIDPEQNLLPVHPRGITNLQNPMYNDAYAYGGKSGAGNPGYCGSPNNPTSSAYGTRCGFGPAARPLNQVIYGDVFPDYERGTDEQRLSDTGLVLEPYTCPADSGYAGAHCPDWAESGLSSYDHFGTSYTANIFTTGFSNGSGTLKSTGPFLRAASTIPDPGRTIAYMENVGRFAWAVREDPCDYLLGVNPNTPNDTVGGWHGKDWTYQTAFADGHVAPILMRSYSPHEETSYPPYPGGGGGNYSFYRCLMIRGDTWQLDVFPAQPRETGAPNRPGGRSSYAGCVSE